MIRLLAILSLALISACQHHPKQAALAKEGIYYVSITDQCGDVMANERKVALEDKLVQKKYAITNRAGMTWPFFQEYGLQEEIPKQDLMPPHTLSHMFRVQDADTEFHDRDARLDITLHCREGVYSFDMITYHFTEGNWSKTVDTGNHEISSQDYANEEELTQLIYQNIVRYSFK